MQADAEHQQDHADLGELRGERLIADEAWRVRADEHAGKQITDDGRQAQALREQAEHEGHHEADTENRDE